MMNFNMHQKEMRSFIREAVQLTVNLPTGPKGSAGNLCADSNRSKQCISPTISSVFFKSRVEWNLDNYRPQRSCGKVMFSQASVILITGEVCGRHPPGRHPSGQTPLLPNACWDTHTPAQCMLGYTTPAATAPDGTHPTGMHSC